MSLAAQLGIEHVFVLMLENRSFDHMLGYSGITGTDAETGLPTSIRGLGGHEFNDYGAARIAVREGAPFQMPHDPPHEFEDVVEQLCGAGVRYPRGGVYPPRFNSGFAASYAAKYRADPQDVMRCYSPRQLPVLHALAREFVVCDNWFSPAPGPTWPNRMFVHAATSGGLDHSPSALEIAQWEAVAGFRFENGTIFDRLQHHGVRRRLYGGDDFPIVAALQGIGLGDVRHYSVFAADVAQADYVDQYVFIEPSYDIFHQYQAGTSQHPLGDVTRGEALIKQTYEAIRNSPAWNSSLLIITWDEHGGFYDHVAPPAAVPPGDIGLDSHHNQHGFTFAQYGPRVPAVIVSPRIPRNRIDHRLYDHASIPATLAMLFDFNPLTARDANANHLDALIQAGFLRTDAPERLPDPADSSLPVRTAAAEETVNPQGSVDDGNLPAILHAAMQQDIAASPADRPAIAARVGAIRTRQQARDYLREVKAKIRPLRAAAAAQ
jgi:phospholipase C